MGEPLRHVFITPKTLADFPIYKKGEAEEFDNLTIEGDEIVSRYGHVKLRTTNLGGVVLGLFYYDYGSPCIVAVTDNGIWYTETAEIGSYSISSIAASGTDWKYNVSSSITGVTVGDTAVINGTTSDANAGNFSVVSVASGYITVTNASGVAQAGAGGTVTVYHQFRQPIWDGGAPEPTGNGTFNASTKWHGGTLFDSVAGFPKLIISNGLTWATNGGEYKIYYTAGAMHYNQATCADGGTQFALGDIVNFKGRLWGIGTPSGGLVFSGEAEPEDWDDTTGSGGSLISVGDGSRNTALASCRDSLYVFKKDAVYKVVGEGFTAATDARVIGPISNVGVGSPSQVCSMMGMVFFWSSTGGLWVIDGDKVHDLTGDMNVTLALTPFIIGSNLNAREIWLSYTGSSTYVYKVTEKRWRKISTRTYNCFLSCSQNGYFLGGYDTTGTVGYVYLIEYASAYDEDDTGSIATTIRYAFSDMTNDEESLTWIEKRPQTLFIYGHCQSAATVDFLYRTSPNTTYSTLALSASTDLPFVYRFPGTYMFNECAIKITSSNNIRIKDIMLKYLPLREER